MPRSVEVRQSKQIQDQKIIKCFNEDITKNSITKY